MINDEAFLKYLRTIETEHLSLRSWISQNLEDKKYIGRAYFLKIPLYLIKTLREDHPLLPHAIAFLLIIALIFLIATLPGLCFMIFCALLIATLISDYNYFKRKAYYNEAFTVMGLDQYEYEAFGFNDDFLSQKRLLDTVMIPLEKFTGKQQDVSYMLYSLAPTRDYTFIKYGIRYYYAQVDLHTKADFKLLLSKDAGKFVNKLQEAATGLDRLASEDKAFEDMFEVYCNDQDEARRVLNTEVMQKLIEVIQNTALSSLNFYIHDQHMDIMFSVKTLNDPYNLRFLTELSQSAIVQKKHAIEFLFDLKELLKT
jgi:hypothetical protein